MQRSKDYGDIKDKCTDRAMPILPTNAKYGDT